jgi:hypothetical protein
VAHFPSALTQKASRAAQKASVLALLWPGGSPESVARDASFVSADAESVASDTKSADGGAFSASNDA